MVEEPAARMSPFRRAAMWTAGKLANMAGGVALTLDDLKLGQWLGSAGGGGAALTGHTINDESAMRITTAFACVRVLAETVGAVTLKVFERQANGNAVEVDHDLAAVLVEKPNSDMRGLEYREAKTTNLAARGNAYSLRSNRRDGNVSALYPIPSSRVTPKRKPDGAVVYTVNDRGRTEDYPAEKIWHWKGFSYDGLIGLSPIECARQAMGLALAGEEANARLFRNGMASAAVVKIPGWLKPDQRKLAEEKLEKMHGGLLNYGRPYLLEGGMEIQKEGIFAPRDAQFLELRKMQVPELCRLWRISPHMIADLERATNNNIEQLSLEFVMYTMLPYFRRIEEKAQELFTVQDRRRFFVRFNFESLLRADSQARAQLYSILLQNGVFNRNEVRALENRNRVDQPGMDEYTVQSNMALLQLLEAINKGQGGGTAAAQGMHAMAASLAALANKTAAAAAPIHVDARSTVHVPELKPEVHVDARSTIHVPEQRSEIHVDARTTVEPGAVQSTVNTPSEVSIKSMPERTSVSETVRDGKGQITHVKQNEKDV